MAKKAALSYQEEFDAIRAEVGDAGVAAAASTLKAVCDEQGVKFGVVATPLRVIGVAYAKVPQIDRTLEIIGRDVVLGRLKAALS